MTRPSPHPSGSCLHSPVSLGLASGPPRNLGPGVGGRHTGVNELLVLRIPSLLVGNLLLDRRDLRDESAI